MTNYQLTNEQIEVINHPAGKHAKILAVAGSGKTSTLVFRVKHLIEDLHTNPSSIQILMFNRLARQQFVERMQEVGILSTLQPRVDTFHSFSYSFIQDLIVKGLLPGNIELWIEEREEKNRIVLHKVIARLEKERAIPPESVDIEEAIQAIQLWKGSLIPPTRAGYKGNNYFPLVYSAFEKERVRENGLTYDDFIPLTVGFLEGNQNLLRQYSSGLLHVIVDEYQDVNYGQQRLVELLAGKRADVMVVGDDDQTIYEWRGARPNYIIREFQSVFDNKPFVQYTLSNSFRFGPVIAQCAFNTIQFNTNRVQKPLIAQNFTKQADLFYYGKQPGQSVSSNKLLADQLITLVKNKGVSPIKIIVLCRMFAQLSGIEAEFITRMIPFKVIGQKPFFERREINVLLDYIRLALNYKQPVNDDIRQQFLNVANTPSRMLARKDLQTLIDGALFQHKTVSATLETFVSDPSSPLNQKQEERVLDWMSILEHTWKMLTTSPKGPVHLVLSDLIDRLAYLSHFDNYYGKGESSFEHKESIINFIAFSREIGLPAFEFLGHVAKMDTTRGAPLDQQIIMTTIFRTKGLEYDYVFIPDCHEGYMPCLFGSGSQVFDTSRQVKEPEPSETIENERRLFYVAVTRAKEAVFIGSSSSSNNANDKNSDGSKSSRFIDELQWQPTTQVMTAFSRIASGNKNSKESFIYTISKFTGIKNLLQTLLLHYLPKVGDNSLMSKVSEIVANSPETPFAYQTAYSSAVMTSKSINHQPKPSPWDDVEA
jgi:DNA helicase-2/ATP-dependent DNA helicase PcrA